MTANLLTNKVMLNGDMLCSVMQFVIFGKAQLPWLSAYIVIGAISSGVVLVASSARNQLTQIACLLASVRAIYSASVDESAIVGCCLLDQEIAVWGEVGTPVLIVHM